MALLDVRGLSQLYGADEILRNISFQVERGERVALVGANGSGKSTLLRIIAGLQEYDEGQISLARNAIVTYVSQDEYFESSHSLWEAMLETFSDSIRAQQRMRELESQLAKREEDGKLQAEYRKASIKAEHDVYDHESRIERVLTGLELQPSEWIRPVSVLSGGQKTRANLARALLRDFDLLLLDEPTNHLDISAIEWLEAYLKGQSRTFIVVAHDRYFLDSVTHRTLELDQKRVTDYPASYTGFLRLREERRSRAERIFREQQQQIQKTEEYVRRYGAGQRSKEAKGRAKRLERVERVERPRDQPRLALRLNKQRRSGDFALQVDHLVVGYEQKPLVQLPDEIHVSHGARVAIVGPNGSGKTTLARTLVGEISPVKGIPIWTAGVSPAYYAQASDGLLRSDSSVLQAFLESHPVAAELARTYLGRFLFEGEDVHKLVPDLSGGERSRLALAVLLFSQPRVLVMDEPTNHLDIAAREALEEALNEFGGTLLLVSHDRYLIDRLATELWAVDNGRLAIYDGNWDDFIAGKNQRRVTYSDVSPAKLPASASPDLLEEMRKIEIAQQPVLTRLRTTSATASIDQLDQLTEEYTRLQSRLRELVQQMLPNGK